MIKDFLDARKGKINVDIPQFVLWKNQWMKECGRVLRYGNQVYEYRHNNSYDDD